jgi:hypothetical protein
MICDCCRRNVEYVRGSFWHGDARICLECFAQWYDLDNDQVDSSDRVSLGNYVRLRQGLPPLAAALAVMLLTMTSIAQASRRCLDYAEIAQTEPRRIVVKERDGCWTFDHHPPRSEVPLLMPDLVLPDLEPALLDSWPDPLEAELRLLEPDPGHDRAGLAPVPAVQPVGMDECLSPLQGWRAAPPLRCHQGAAGH